MKPSKLQPSFDHLHFQALAKSDFFKPSKNVRDLSEKYMKLGRDGTAIGFGVSCVAQQISIELLTHFGTSSQKHKYLPGLTAGLTIGGIANTENSGGTDLRSMNSRLVHHEGCWLLQSQKSCYTNGPADVVFLSAWVDSADVMGKPRLEVIILDGGRLSQEDLRQTLPGFRSGRTGLLKVDRLPIDLEEKRLGPVGSGSQILKFCFDLERFMISALIQGLIARTESQTIHKLHGRQSFHQSLLDHQWVQDKVIQLRRTAQTLRGLLELCHLDAEKIPGTIPIKLRAQNGSLSLLKWLSVDDGITAMTAALEATGMKGLTNEAESYTALTDLLHLKFLGGTRELQKNFLIQDIITEAHSTPQEQEANEQVRTTQKTG